MKHRRTREGRGVIGTIAIVGGFVILAMVLAGLYIIQPGPLKSLASSITGTNTKNATHNTAPVASSATYLSQHGVVSPSIVAQNKLPGTTAWKITSTKANGTIEGFANQNYAQIGEQVTLYVSTNASSFHVVAYRMGYYQGKGGRQFWASKTIKGVTQPTCPINKKVNMVSCDNWKPSLTFTIPSSFLAGDYLLKLVGNANQQAYIPLTIWNPKSNAAYVIMNRSFTEEAWNTFGGYSFYQGKGPCAPGASTYPVCNRARVVSFDRPYASGHGASDFLSNEYPLIRFMEKHGLDVTYATDLTIAEHPSFALQHKALLSLGHDEVWTLRERLAAKAALQHGVNIAFMGAASVLRHARLQSSPLGKDREVVDYRNSQEDPLNGKGNPLRVTGNTWASPPTNWPGSGFVGEIYAGYLAPGSPPASMVVNNSSAWIFKGTNLKNGSKVPNVIESDIDHIDPLQLMPSNIEVLAHSPVSLKYAYTNQGKWSGYTYSDMTYYDNTKSKGGVFDSGNNNWINALSACPTPTSSCPSSQLRTMTGNLLWLFGQGPAGKIIPSVPNWKTVVPYGS